jgi:mannonate dehydratase
MKLTFRWYGPKDTIPLEFIEQIPNISGVVTSVYDVKPGEVWSLDSLLRLKDLCSQHHLKMEVIESIPVSEDIKIASPKRDEHIAAFIKNLELCGQVGVKCVCYNFMPVFDWLRTDMHHQNADGSTSLSFSFSDFAKVDPKHLHLPGWDESYSPEELQKLLKAYQQVSHDDLFNNMVYFLKAVTPTCEKVGIQLGVHPDDPPWDIFGIPRIVSSEKDVDRLFKAVPSKANGLTLCTGSFGAGRNNDIVKMAGKYAKEGRLPFVHLRNVLYTDDKNSFTEMGHCSCMGSLDMAKIVKALVDNGFDGYVRPDHGRNIFGENGKPGYGLYDRALGCAYINGLFEGIEKFGKGNK